MYIILLKFRLKNVKPHLIIYNNINVIHDYFQENQSDFLFVLS